ncbi:type II toxin-antitoxin system PemK/MazF family toxin [Nocardioides agariphilus]|jgi:mRNA interferase MazF|uniref:Type II toxin-antitoxin system PemK/MazF family toxin n=1 Tax=Nocardioides agariphilus TaxID=433664 RepID=A0A930VRT9_9ACTN|nr:type II toxin-antitoxin system PemK/MazF family toxin [Nocardioides agariphilus]MBF4768760.1 type II toxin-antitoxin system PemK/MazF family toxin [Nocardioides agariphilus]
MLRSGDVVDVDLGLPRGREAGYPHPGIVVTAQRVLDAKPSVVHVVPLTSTLRGFHSEVHILPDDDNGLDRESAAQCQHLRAVSTERVRSVQGRVGPVVLAQVRDAIALLLDLDVGA